MNKKSLLAIERIISCINELHILTKDKDANYFYKSFELNALVELVYEIENNLNKISKNIKLKYNNINWFVIEKYQHNDEIFGKSLKVGKVWELSSKIIKDELLDNLKIVLEKEIPDYYKNLCTKRHEEMVKYKKKN